MNLRNPVSTKRPPRNRPGIAARLRPHERVEEYLHAEFERPDVKEGSRLPAMKDLAERLRVSIATVQGVYRKLAQGGRIRTEVGNGSFLIAPRLRKEKNQLTLALGIRIPTDLPVESWYYRIYGGMLKATLRSVKPIMLRTLSQTATLGGPASKELLEEFSSSDGLILFPPGPHDSIRLAYEQAGKPVVDLNPPSENATANFVSPDYFSASRTLGLAWKETGRKRIVMIGPALVRSVSARLRNLGMLAALGADLGTKRSYRFVEVADVVERDGHAAMSSLLTDPPAWRRAGKDAIPDAVFCTGDLLALGALQAIREAGLRAPEDVRVVGGTNADISDTFCPQLTRTKQPLEKMGEELIAMLRQRIQLSPRGESSLPGKFLPLPYTGGATTRPEENVLLHISNQ